MVAERLGKYIEYKRISYYAFENQIGVSRGSISKAVKELKSIGSNVLENILINFDDLSPTWLLTGEGSMLKVGDYNSQSNQIKPLLKDEQNKEIPAIPADQGIPLIPLEAMAGFGLGGTTQVMEYDCEKYVVPDFRGAEFLIQVKGSSMYPKYSSGDIVACKKLSLDTFFQWNKVYVIDSEQGVLIKRINPGSDLDHITLVSENERYAPFEIHKKEILSLAIVIGVIRLE